MGVKLSVGLLIVTSIINIQFICVKPEVKNPGVLVFVSNHGVDDVVKATGNYYAEQLLRSVYEFKDLNGTFIIFIWPWDWSLSNIQFQKVSKPYAKAWTDEYIHITLQDLSMDLTAEVSAHSRHRFFDSKGKLFAHVCFNAEVTFAIGPNNTAKVVKCFAEFTCPTFIELSTDYSQLMNNWIQQQMVAHFKAQMLCDSMSTFTTDYKVYTIIHDPGFAIDLSIKHLLGISNAGLLMALNGEVFDYNKGPLGNQNPMAAPLLPSKIEFDIDKMVTFVVSPYSLNSFFFTSARIGMLDEEVNAALLPPDERVLFAADCVDICIGKQIPTIGEMYPHQFVSFRITAHESINTEIDEGGISLTNSGEFTFFIGNITLFAMNFDLRLNATPFIRSETVLVNAVLNEHKFYNIKLMNTTVGHIANDVLVWVSDIIGKVNILPELHDTFTKGVDMGTFICVPHKDKNKRQKVKFNDVHVQLHKGAMVVSADFTLKINAIGFHTNLTDESSGDDIKYIGSNGFAYTSDVRSLNRGRNSTNTSKSSSRDSNSKDAHAPDVHTLNRGSNNTNTLSQSSRRESNNKVARAP